MEQTTPEWKRMMEVKMLRFSVLACWIIVIVNPIWTIFDYYTIDSHRDMVILLDLIATSTVLGAVLLRKKLRLSARALGGFSLMVISLSITYPYYLVDLEDFRIMTFTCVGLYVFSGMIYVWDMKFSIFLSVLIIGLHVLFYLGLSDLTVGEFLSEGGILVLTIIVLMIVLIEMKYALTKRETIKTLDLQNKQVELIAAKNLAEDAKKKQSQFLSNMSHEIRTPMNGILGITRVLQKTELSKEQHEYLNAIEKSADNLMVVINDILDFSKVEAGRLEIEETSFNLLDRIRVVENLLRIKAEEKGVYIKTEVDENVPEWVLGDPVRLNQILLNLVGNGLKFTEKGGVTMKVVVREKLPEKVTLRFDVIDTGIGIPEDKIDDVFKSFTQANSDTTRKFGGTGLGLTITKNLIELQGGSLTVESKVGEGSTFRFELDYLIDKNKSKNEDEMIETNNVQKEVRNQEQYLLEKVGSIDVLLVEDHDINQMLAMKVLGDWGFNVDLAVNGLEAVEMVGKKMYDMVLMDISMPEMDGYTATKKIRSTLPAPARNVPIVAMTASALIGENEKCFKAGMNDYVPKPFNPAELLQKIADNIN